MPKILLFTDLHLDQYRQFSTTLENGLNSRLYAQWQVMEQVAKIAKDNEVGTVLFLGDFFNSQMDSISKMVYIIGFEALRLIERSCQHLYVVAGNHDLYRDHTILRTFSTFSDVVTVTTEEVIAGHKFILVPWGDTVTEYMNGEYVVGHMSIIGSRLNNLSDVQATEGIKARSLTPYRKVLSGHYHIRQSIGPNIEYIGAVNPVGFGELGAPGYVTLFNPDTAELDTIELNTPRFFYININTPGDMERFISERDPNNYYRLFITNRNIPSPELDEKVVSEYKVEEKVETRLEVQEEPIEELMLKFIDMVETKVDKKAVKKELQEIMEETK